MNITPGNILTILPHATMSNIEKYLPVFLKYQNEYKIDTPLRVAAYWAHVGHESQQLSRMEENLNYSYLALLKTWPKRFNIISAKQYERKPEKIANKVYALRMGNGTENSGDGWRHRGKGAIQLTGKDTQKQYSLDTYGDLRIINNPDLLLAPEDAIRSSLWFWKTRNLNALADKINSKDLMKELTLKINGGLNGLVERNKFFNNAVKVFNITLKP